MLAGKTLPPPAQPRKVDATESTLQEECAAEQEKDEWQEIDIMDLAMREGMKAAGETAKKPCS